MTTDSSVGFSEMRLEPASLKIHVSWNDLFHQLRPGGSRSLDGYSTPLRVNVDSSVPAGGLWRQVQVKRFGIGARHQIRVRADGALHNAGPWCAMPVKRPG